MNWVGGSGLYGSGRDEFSYLVPWDNRNAFGKQMLIALVTSHIPDNGQVTIRYFGPYANAHLGKVRKLEEVAHKLIIIELTT